uniref:Uncharacterized protein n=1 Tax=Anguilla anguilla TaxID=7936 RepID=A0A0E9W8C5_ANGAN
MFIVAPLSVLRSYQHMNISCPSELSTYLKIPQKNMNGCSVKKTGTNGKYLIGLTKTSQ